jgi:predicted NAD/FAD-binding protein
VNDRRKIAVVGGGISGLGAAWLLARKHEVRLFEKERRAGGHALTVDVPADAGGDARFPVDVGFIVYNERTYPLLTRFFRELAVPTQASDMSFGVTCLRCGLEYCSTSPRTLFAWKRNALRPSFWRLLLDFRRFFAEANATLGRPPEFETPLAEWTGERKLSPEFVRHFLAPMTAAIWSTATAEVGDFPVGELFSFYANHGLLAAKGRPLWRTVTGGSRSYVSRVTASLGDALRLGAAATAIVRRDDGVEIRTAHAPPERFDAVVVAVHADEALRLLVDADDEERELLGAFRYADNEAILHVDPTLLPRRALAQAAWNYRTTDCRSPGSKVEISYGMNRLQALPTTRPHVVTLNPARPPAPESVLGRYAFAHPTGTLSAMRARPRLRERSGARRTYFAGAHLGFGFHEDGFRSAVEAAARLGVAW